MKFALDNPPFPGAGCHVYDANGLEWFQVIEFDTETGEIKRYVTDADNCLIEDPEAGELLTEMIRTAPPLAYKKCEPGERYDPRHNAYGVKLLGCSCPGDVSIVNFDCPAHRALREKAAPFVSEIWPDITGRLTEPDGKPREARL